MNPIRQSLLLCSASIEALLPHVGDKAVRDGTPRRGATKPGLATWLIC
jgi:hypothetical protein